MPVISIYLEGDPDYPKFDGEKVIALMGEDAPPLRLMVLERGMTSGRASVVLHLTLPDGTAVITETSLRLWLVAADTLKAKYGDQQGNPEGEGEGA